MAVERGLEKQVSFLPPLKTIPGLGEGDEWGGELVVRAKET